MIHINRNDTKIPDVFRNPLLKAEQTRAEEFFGIPWHVRSQRRFDWGPTVQLLRQALPSLLELFHAKCAYCETRLDKQIRPNLERFRPKGGALDHDGTIAPDHYWWLAFDWNNLLVTCQPCNIAKAGRFPIRGRRATPNSRPELLPREKALLLDPTVDDPETDLVFTEDGKVASETPRGQATIEILALNREVLVASRAWHIKQLAAFLDEAAYPLTAATPSTLADSIFAERLIQWLTADAEFLAPTRQLVSGWATELGIRSVLESFLRGRGLSAHGLTEYVRSTDDVSRTARNYRSVIRSKERFSVETTNRSSNAAYFAGARKLQRVEIHNFRGIANLELRMSPPTTSSEPWLMLVGENAVGKSSVLQAIGLALMGQKHLDTLGLDGSSFVRSYAWSHSHAPSVDAGYVRVHLTNLSRPVELTFQRNSKKVRCDPPDPQVLLLGYGATRLLPRTIKPKDRLQQYIRVKNLFDPYAKLNHVEGWLTDSAVLPTHKFDQIALALKQLLLLGPDDYIERAKRRVFVHVAGTRIPLTDLSDGYQSVVALAVDIMMVVSEKWPTIESAEGIVLLDEIEVHLHPFWKMQIVDRFRRVFPRLAFVVTTHDPLCLRGLFPGEIVVLRRGIMGVESEVITESLEHLRADQLLTSPLFGLAHTRAASVQAAVERYADLMSNVSRTADEQCELEELRNYLSRSIQGGETPFAREQQSALTLLTLHEASSRADPQEPLKPSVLENLSRLRNRLESLG